LHSSASQTLKIAVVAPIPKPMVIIAVAANPGELRRTRAAYRISWKRLMWSSRSVWRYVSNFHDCPQYQSPASRTSGENAAPNFRRTAVRHGGQVEAHARCHHEVGSERRLSRPAVPRLQPHRSGAARLHYARAEPRARSRHRIDADAD